MSIMQLKRFGGQSFVYMVGNVGGHLHVMSIEVYGIMRVEIL